MIQIKVEYPQKKLNKKTDKKNVKGKRKIKYLFQFLKPVIVLY